MEKRIAVRAIATAKPSYPNIIQGSPGASQVSGIMGQELWQSAQEHAKLSCGGGEVRGQAWVFKGDLR